MSLSNILKLAGGALNAQTVRLNTIASNLANVETVAGSSAGAYRAKRPVFATELLQAAKGLQSGFGVEVKAITESKREIPQLFDPSNPLADAEGYVYR
jgi:flagellar basal-body rod protein FlgC